jgi:hypothetical protein
MNTGGRNRAERRLAAILAADVAGYTRLIGANEEGTLNRLKSIRSDVIDLTITAHRGRLVKTTGDGLLVEFASVVDALRCATEVQQAMAGAMLKPPPRNASNSVSASTWAMSSSRMATFSATGSMSSPGTKLWPIPAGFAYRPASRRMPPAGSTSSSTIWASGPSKTSLGRSGSTLSDRKAPSLTLPACGRLRGREG